MAQGVEVLQALLEGRRVRRNQDGLVGMWIDLRTVRSLNIAALLDREWEIGAPHLTFGQAIVAMEEGYRVQREEDLDYPVQMRYVSAIFQARRLLGPDVASEWGATIFSSEDIFATDWRRVEESKEDR